MKTDDIGLKSRMNHVLVGLSTDSAKDLQKLDDEVRQARPNRPVVAVPPEMNSEC